MTPEQGPVPPSQPAERVTATEGPSGRRAVLSCGHSFRIGAAMPAPRIGAAACCPICEGIRMAHVRQGVR
ncbi:MAG: hypothetical protein AB7Q16_24145 [Vicinamibacterales bacterium]